MQLGLSLSLTGLPILTQGGGVLAWVTRDQSNQPVLFIRDEENNRGWYSGQHFSTQADLLTAVNGSAAGSVWSIGPFVPPGNPELVTNGTFSNGTTGWSAFNGGTIQAVAGELELTAAGSLSGFSQFIALSPGRAAVFSGKGRRGTSGSQQFIIGSNNNSTLNANSGSVAIPSTTDVTGSFEVSGRATGMWVGARNSSGTGTGTAYFDNITGKEAVPFAGWDSWSDGITFYIDFTTPASVPATQVIAQSGITSERDRIRIDLSPSLALAVTFRVNAIDFGSISLGTLAANTRYRLALTGNAAGNSFAASLNGGDSVVDGFAELPGSTHLWIGRSFTGETFAGTIHKFVMANGRQPNWWLEGMTAAASAYWAEGDSYTANTGGTGLSLETQTISGLPVITTAVGGSAMADVEARVSARAFLLRNNVFLLWDGSPNDFGSVTDYCDRIGRIVATVGHQRFILIPPGVPYNMSPDTALAIRTEMLARWPENVLDWREWIANTAGVINENRMLNYPTDLYHLNGTAMTEMANGVVAFRAGKGW